MPSAPIDRLDAYEVLGVTRDTDLPAIKAAHASLMIGLTAIIDQGPDFVGYKDALSQRANASKALAILSDPTSRRLHDLAHPPRPSHSPPLPPPPTFMPGMGEVPAPRRSLWRRILKS